MNSGGCKTPKDFVASEKVVIDRAIETEKGKTVSKARIRIMTRVMVIFFCITIQALYGNIHVIYTSALLPQDFESRKQEYLTSLKRWRSYGIDPWIIEATNVSSSFFDKISDRVLYPQVHNDTYKNKGCNELLSMRASISFLPFLDDDIVIKVTGRYLLYRPNFIKTLLQNPDYDVYVKGYPTSSEKTWYQDTNTFIFTGCFAMKWKIFKEMMLSFDEIKLEKDLIWIEQAVAGFIVDNNLRMLEVERIYMLAKIFGLKNEVWKL